MGPILGPFLFHIFTLAFLLQFNDNIKALATRTCGVAVNMSPCHGEDRGFDSRQVRQALFIRKWPGSSVGRAGD